MKTPPRTVPRRLGPYRVQQPLGAGGMGEVFAAWDERLRRQVALKRLKSDSVEGRRRFLREARAAAALDHVGIVRVYDVLEHVEGDWLVMERITGQSLARHLKSSGPLAPTALLDLAGQLIEALSCAHQSGLVHRDLKTENVMITDDGKVKVVDFGLAVDPRAEDTTVTNTGHIIGTARSMSPEQILDRPVDPRSDYFSLGVLLYECATGLAPFRAATVQETLVRVCSHRPPGVTALRGDLPAPLSALIERLMEKDPACRPRNHDELRAAQASVADQAGSATSGQGVTLNALQAETLAAKSPAAASASPASASPASASPASASPASASPASASASRFEVPPTTPEVSATALEEPGSDSHWRRGTKLSRPTPRMTLTLAAVLITLITLITVAGVTAITRPDLLQQLAPSVAGTAVPDAAVRVAVLPSLLDPPDIQGADLLQAALDLELERALIGRQRLVVVSSRVDQPLPASAAPAGLILGVDLVLEVRLDCDRDSCRGPIELIRTADGGVVGIEQLILPLDDLSFLGELIGKRANQLFPAHPGKDENRAFASSRDLESLLTLRQEFLSGDWLDREEELIRQVTQLRTRAPHLIEAHVFEADLLSRPEIRNAERLERAYALLQVAESMAPRDPRPLYRALTIALREHDLQRARPLLSRLEALQPGDPSLLAQRANLAWREGSQQEALQWQREAVRRQPIWSNFYQLANYHYRSGQTADARRVLADLLDRTPEHVAGAWLLAQLELLQGSPQVAVELYERLLRLTPSYTVRINLGTALMLTGDTKAAAEHFAAALADQPDSPAAHLNLADALGLSGRQQESQAHYLKVLESSSELFEGEPWQRFTVRAQALAHLGRHLEAAEALRQAMHLAPEEPQLAYEAALVYTLLGENTSAIANARRALDLGIAPVWFEYPWFDGLAGHLKPVSY